MGENREAWGKEGRSMILRGESPHSAQTDDIWRGGGRIVGGRVQRRGL